MKIGIRCVGGIGNQCFQWATARAVALHNEAELYIDKSYYDSPRPYPFPYELDNFSIEAPVRRCIGTQVKEPHYHYSPHIVREYTEDIWLNGYFQSEKYFKDIRDVLLGDFCLKRRPSHLCQQWEKTIRETKFPVAVHIRRGERVNEPTARRMHGLISAEYYMEAMEIVEQNAPKEPTWIIFSDDPEWVMKFSPYNDVVVGTSAPEDMYLMSLCRGAIIANSSFSWFGAWLGRPDNIVVAPENWNCGRTDNTKDVLPDEWIKIKAKYL